MAGRFERRGSLWAPAPIRARYIGRGSSPRYGGGSLLADPPPSGGGVVPLFVSNWTTALGQSDAAIRDTNQPQPWTSQFNFGGGQIMTVVPGGPPGYANAMRIQQRGPALACEMNLDGVIPAATDYYLRWYMLNADTSGTEDHIVSAKTGSDDGCMIHCAHTSGATTWTYRTRCFNGPPGYPVASFQPNFTFQNNQWYRFEAFIHYVTSTTFRHWRRVYDASGSLILTSANFRQEDYGSANYLGFNLWTLAAFNTSPSAQAYTPSDITKLQHFYMGNNGQTNSVDTGLFWYYGAVRIQTAPTTPGFSSPPVTTDDGTGMWVGP